MSRFKIDPVTRDRVRVNGQFVRLRGRTEAEIGEEIVQGVRVRLLLFRGEVQLDQKRGVPYLEEVLRAGISPAALVGVFREAILGSPGMVSLEVLTLTFDSPTRVLSVDWEGTGTSEELANDLRIEDTLQLQLDEAA